MTPANSSVKTAPHWLAGFQARLAAELSDSRVVQPAALDDLLTQLVASLMAARADTLQGVAQDGMRVRASAGASSFRRQERLEACLEEARAQMRRLVQEREQQPAFHD